MIKIVCTSCQKPLSLDETKLPPNEAVSFPCPACKAKLSVDRRNLPAESTTAAPAAADNRPPAYVPHDDEDGFGAKALIVGVDHPALRQAAKLIGFLPVHYPTPQLAREFYMQEFPQVVFIHPGQTSAPPLEGFQPIISLTPADRRRSFFVLFAENLRTLDGNAAFLYGVNLVVGTRDVAQFPQIYREAHAYHERLYAAMTAVLKAAHG